MKAAATIHPFPFGMCKNTILFLFLLQQGSSAFAQGGYRPHPLLSPMWQAELEYMEPSQVKDTSMEHGFSGGTFTFRMPVYTGKDWLSADGGKPFFAVLAQASASARQTQIDYLEPDRWLTMGRLGVTGLMAKGLRHLILANISVMLPSESFQFNPGFLRPNATLIWRKLYHDNKLWHTVGIAYTPILGKEVPLPILGLGLKLGNDDQVQFTFPYNAAYTHLFSRKLSLSARAQMMGGNYFLQPDSIYTEDPLRHRFLIPRLGIVARYYTSRHVVITPEIALTGTGRLRLADDVSRLSSTLFFRISLQVRFGERPAAAPILNFDPGDSGFDPTYLTE
jgi:hypothetical protein